MPGAPAGIGAAPQKLPFAPKKAISFFTIASTLVIASLRRERHWYCENWGMARAARIPMIATVIISSISVKPPRRVRSLRIVSLPPAR